MITEERIHKAIIEAITQLNLFGEPEEINKPYRRKKTPEEKEAQAEVNREKRRKETERKFKEGWAKRGFHEGELF